jgi:branched-chain amino acid transport system permease protein
MLQQTINGFFSGAIYGLVAVGLVLVYKGARVFNFAQGEFGTVATFAAWMMVERGVPLALAMVGGIVVGLLFGLLLERLVVRPLLGASRVILLVATAGVAIGSISLQLVLGEAEPRILDPVAGTDPIYFLGATILPQQILILVALAAVAVGLFLFFRTNLGLAILATSQDPMATRLMGISVKRVSALVWGLAAGLGALAGVLQAGVPGFFTPGFMTSGVLLASFTGAVLGGMTSLPGAFLGGILVGIAHNVGPELFPSSISGSAELTVFGLLLLVLLVRPQGLLGSEA